MYAALQALGFEAGTLGNHEFNYGLEYLNRVIETAGLPIVNANVLDPATGNSSISLQNHRKDLYGYSGPIDDRQDGVQGLYRRRF